MGARRARRGGARSGIPLALRMLGVTSAGTTPPVVTLTGVPDSKFALQINITTGGTLGVAVFKWSTDGGLTFVTGVTTAASVALGTTGITANFAAGTYATDNVYTASAAVLS